MITIILLLLLPILVTNQLSRQKYLILVYYYVASSYSRYRYYLVCASESCIISSESVIKILILFSKVESLSFGLYFLVIPLDKFLSLKSRFWQF